MMGREVVVRGGKRGWRKMGEQEDKGGCRRFLKLGQRPELHEVDGMGMGRVMARRSGIAFQSWTVRSWGGRAKSGRKSEGSRFQTAQCESASFNQSASSLSPRKARPNPIHAWPKTTRQSRGATPNAWQAQNAKG